MRKKHYVFVALTILFVAITGAGIVILAANDNPFWTPFLSGGVAAAAGFAVIFASMKAELSTYGKPLHAKLLKPETMVTILSKVDPAKTKGSIKLKSAALDEFVIELQDGTHSIFQAQEGNYLVVGKKYFVNMNYSFIDSNNL